jgi:hypothetical protein
LYFQILIVLSFPPVANIVLLPTVLSILQIALIDKELLLLPAGPEATKVELAGVPTLVVAEF